MIPAADPRFINKGARAIGIALRKTTRPQTIYISSGKLAFPLVIYACALTNLVFWGNLSQWVYSDYTVKNEKEDQYERASLTRRLVYAGGLATLGLSITTGFLLVSKRVIKRIDILPGSHIALYTGLFRREVAKDAIELPIDSLTLKRSMYTGEGHNQAISPTGSYTQLLRKNQLIGYLVDRRGSFLASPRVLDELFYHSR